MLVVNQLLSGDEFDYQCHSNLVRAVLPYGLEERDVHDVLNVFQVTGLTKDGKYFMSVPSNSISLARLISVVGNRRQQSQVIISRFSPRRTCYVL